MKIKRLNTGDAAVGDSDIILYTGGIGSCVVICLWDPYLKIGGMAHMPLSHSTQSVSRESFSFGIAPDVAFPYLLQKMKTIGSQHEHLTLRLVGGGNMFSEIKSFTDIGKEILATTRSMAIDLKLPLQKSCTGGKFGKSAEFNIYTGDIYVCHTNGDVDEI